MLGLLGLGHNYLAWSRFVGTPTLPSRLARRLSGGRDTLQKLRPVSAAIARQHALHPLFQTVEVAGRVPRPALENAPELGPRRGKTKVRGRVRPLLDLSIQAGRQALGLCRAGPVKGGLPLAETDGALAPRHRRDLVKS